LRYNRVEPGQVRILSVPPRHRLRISRDRGIPHNWSLPGARRTEEGDLRRKAWSWLLGRLGGMMAQETGKDEGSSQAAQPFLKEIRRAMEGRSFASIEEAQAFIDLFSLKWNRAAIPTFDGLSPEQMSRLLYFPFDSPHIVTFAPTLNNPPDAPIAAIFALLAAAIGERGIKTTATGNLPLSVVRPATLAYLGEHSYAERTHYGALRSELDARELHVTRLMAVLAGLMRKYRGSFVLTKLCRSQMSRNGLAGVYPLLLRAHLAKFNWAYGDMYGDLRLIQDSALFTLLLLHRHGNEWREQPSMRMRSCARSPGYWTRWRTTVGRRRKIW
jgi:hypothetical protein